MEKKYLIINIGSASKKYSIYSDRELLAVHLEKETGDYTASLTLEGKREEKKIVADDYENAATFIIKTAQDKNILNALSDISAIGVRIVAPGIYFQDHRKIDAEYMSKLKAAQEMAPLHIAPAINELEKLLALTSSIPIYGISDSAFYKNMPIEAKLYGLPQDIAKQFEIYRYGYHGISMESILDKITTLNGSVPSKLVICHLGSGSSITALKDGAPVDTSMGFTPLEGLPMGSRVGNIDAGAVLYLLKKLKISPEELEMFLNKKSGLLGISGKTQFVKELISFEKSGDESATIALSIYSRAVRKYIGAYAALLDGLDMVVFTATIGERSAFMRNKICSGLRSLGIVLDRQKNESTISTNGFIHASNIKVAVVVTDETAQIVYLLSKFKVVGL